MRYFIITALLLSSFISCAKLQQSDHIFSLPFIPVDKDNNILLDSTNMDQLEVKGLDIYGEMVVFEGDIQLISAKKTTTIDIDTDPIFPYKFYSQKFSNASVEPTTFYLTYPNGIIDTLYIKMKDNSEYNTELVQYNGVTCERDMADEERPYILVR